MAPPGGRRRRTLLLRRLDETRKLLERARVRLAATAEQGEDLSPAGEWLLDNFHVIEEHIRQVRDSLPPGYYGELPELKSGPLAGYPRAYEIAITLISHTEARIDLDNVTRFVAEFQRVAPLSLGELWAIPAMVRLGLIESVRRMTLRAVERLDEIAAAEDWAARFRGGAPPTLVIAQFGREQPPLTPTFVSRLLQRLHGGSHDVPALGWLERWLGLEGFTAEGAATQAIERLALTHQMMTNSITSLLAVARLDWRTFVEGQSRTEAVLRTDPSGSYPRMTFATRDRYRHVVERIARRSPASETAVARAAVDLARMGAAADPDSREAHVGYYLVDEGVAVLEAATRYRPRWQERVGSAVHRHANAVYVGGLLALTALALALVLWLGGGPGRAVWPVVVVLALLPAADTAVALVNQILTAVLPPRLLPKLDFTRSEIPPEFRTAVVIPILFPDVTTVHESLETLEVRYLANRESHLHFAILSDFTDADAETRPGDDAIVAAARDGIAALNERYAPEARDAFYLFHRPRRWNPQQEVWMGWERKRGKLAEFNRFVRGAAEGAFSVIEGNVEPLRLLRYVITLDADTVLPPEAAPDLVGAIAHPLNRAEYDPAASRVVRGYGILQPRVGVSLPSAARSRFAAIFSGRPGVDPYTTAVSDVYQDLFGEGSFTGKGIYDIAAFEQATHGRFPENRLLSHDLIEGNFARTALVTDVNIYDDYPVSYATYTRRKHRWIRGDWQLLQWLTGTVPGPDGPEPNRLSWLSRWKILDNLRRSTVEIAQLLFLVAAWTVLPGSPLRWTALVLGLMAAPLVTSLLIATARTPWRESWRAYFGGVGRDAVRGIGQLALGLVFLPHQAWVSADGILRTLWRLYRSRRCLLEWQTASAAERALPAGHAAWRGMAPALGLIAAIGVAVAIAWIRADDAGYALRLAAASVPFLTAWMASPLIASALDAPAIRPLRPLPEAARALMLRYALLHWRFFERFAGPETHWLAPDNFQEDPDPVVAMRTSPTNLGLQLLATVSAYDLGFLTLEALLDRLERMFASLEKLPRFRGHFYNWYDLSDLSVLEPAYVSTVDSGNLAGHLIALRQACLTLPDEPGSAHEIADAETVRRLEAIAARAHALAMEMEFGFLLDPERKLLAIGYRLSTHALDPSSYDLLASEARLASFMAIAKNDLPVDYWFRLGRTLSRASGAPAMVSWSGSMFEYLMPALVMRSFPFTLMDQTHRGAVRRHIAYGSARGVPWGISESAYNLRDRHGTYQYRAFGVPDLALKRGLGRDLVVAPYASALAALFEPEKALRNLTALERLAALGPFGFKDALDYSRPASESQPAVVATYMAHHIGMSLVAFTNVLADGVWQRRFHADPMVRSVELLLHERVPRRLTLRETRSEDLVAPRAEPEVERPSIREVEAVDAELEVALLGRPPLALMVSHCGGGYSRYRDLAITRWRADGTCDDTGQFCYVKDPERGRLWSASHQPVCAPAERYRAVLAADRVTFVRTDGDTETRTEIAVVPDDAAEVRRVTVTNNGTRVRDIELTSYGEIVLAPPAADRAHPAFGNLFIETEWHAWCTAITARRRPRSPADPQLWCVHVVDSGPERVGSVSFETDRARFLGRGRSVRDPAALDGDRDGNLAGTTGAVLDPIFALRTRVRLRPGQSASVAFTTLIAATRERAFELAGRYHDPHAAQRALDLASTSSQLELRELGLTPADATDFQRLAGHLFFGSVAARAPEAEHRMARGSQHRLWAHGISGDLPIVVATIEGAEGIQTLRQVLAAHRYWRRRGIEADLVILNTHATTYQAELEAGIAATIGAGDQADSSERPGGVFVRRADLLGAEDLRVLRTAARLLIPCDGRPLGRIVRALAPASEIVGDLTAIPPAGESGGVAPTVPPAEAVAGPAEAPFAGDDGPEPDNGFGGLTSEGDYEIRVRGDRVPPAPWVNVIANPEGGFVVSERGAGFTWARNSYFYRLTPWHNDAVADPATEAIYLRDEATGAIWCPTPAPMRSSGRYRVRHAPGESAFFHERGGIATRLRLGMVPERAVKCALLQVTNRGAESRRLSITAYAEWTLGVTRGRSREHIVTTFKPGSRAVFASNPFDPQYADWAAFHAISEPVRAHTADRRAFLGRNGSTALPAALLQSSGQGRLGDAAGPALDPCSALQCAIELAPGESRDIVVLLGAMSDLEGARQAVDEWRDPARAAAALGASAEAWNGRLSRIAVRTPEPLFDAMINRWTLYQALACRMWARSALYQSNGAYGFRDQLQDAMALVYAEPGLAREHILRAAARQFLEGDVQHWWHPETGRGVRTRFSDDLVWLPFVVSHYVRVTGDTSVLDEPVPFLRMRELDPDEHEVYDLPEVTTETASVHEHCLRALRRASTAGAHGLPLIGGGDWNDGMNRVGAEGRGESVWLAWFLVATLRGYARDADARDDPEAAAACRLQADRYVTAVETHGWDGAWYRRAYFDDGTPLGSAANDECRIDSLAQSWSVISGAGDPVRQARAMQSLEEQLVRPGARLIQLLDPPFDRTPHDPGYIKGYLPGVRENGGQYTHAALWVVLATALRGDGDRAFELFQMLNPLTHGRTPENVRTYKVEPYVVAADVYTADGHLGRGGWTWYTGAASWMYRVGLEGILGFTKRGDRLHFEPNVPAHWPSFSVDYRHGATTYAITVREPGRIRRGRAAVTADGIRLEGSSILLVDDGRAHEVVVSPG